LQTAGLPAFVFALAERWLLLQSKGTQFPLHSAWSLRLALLAHMRVAEPQSEDPLSAALGLAAALDLASFGVRASKISQVEETPKSPFSAALGMAAALGILLRLDVLCCAVQ
jgi:hypothetical protein